MNPQQLQDKFSNLITEDHLEDAAQLLITESKTSPDAQNKAHRQYIGQQAEHLAGQLNKLNSDVRNGVLNIDEMLRHRNQIRKNLQDLFRVFQDPTHKINRSWGDEIMFFIKKWGPMAGKIYLVYTAIIFTLVIVIGSFIYSKFREMEKTIPSYPPFAHEFPSATPSISPSSPPPQPTPREVCAGQNVCCIVTGALSSLHSTPNPFSERLIELPSGQLLTVQSKRVYNHGNLSTMTFYKVSAEGYTGWVKHENCQYVNPKCQGL